MHIGGGDWESEAIFTLIAVDPGATGSKIGQYKVLFVRPRNRLTPRGYNAWGEFMGQLNKLTASGWSVAKFHGTALIAILYRDVAHGGTPVQIIKCPSCGRKISVE